MKNMTQHHSFVVRIWREPEKDTSGWRGWVQHAGTGEETYVKDLNELLAFIERQAGQLTDSPLSTADAPAARLK